MIREVIVVEGKDDLAAVKKACQAEVIITNGLGITWETLEQIRQAQKRCGVIVLTDPDFPGEKIRGIINREVPGCRNAFIYQGQKPSGISRIGVEYASSREIMEALTKARLSEYQPGEYYSLRDLYAHELVGQPHSRALRAKVGEMLGLGKTNAKNFLNRLNAYSISRQEWEEALASVRGELDD